jgi:hypothetical protein
MTESLAVPASEPTGSALDPATGRRRELRRSARRNAVITALTAAVVVLGNRQLISTHEWIVLVALAALFVAGQARILRLTGSGGPARNLGRRCLWLALGTSAPLLAAAGWAVLSR